MSEMLKLRQLKRKVSFKIPDVNYMPSDPAFKHPAVH